MTSAGDEWMREIERRHGYDAMAQDEEYGPMTSADGQGVYLTHGEYAAMTSRIEALEAENKALTNFGICEIAARNPNVMDYMQHWEGRAEAAEAENARLRDEGQAVVDRWDTPLWKDAEATGRIINRLRAALKGDSHD